MTITNDSDAEHRIKQEEGEQGAGEVAEPTVSSVPYCKLEPIPDEGGELLWKLVNRDNLRTHGVHKLHGTEIQGKQLEAGHIFSFKVMETIFRSKTLGIGLPKPTNDLKQQLSDLMNDYANLRIESKRENRTGDQGLDGAIIRALKSDMPLTDIHVCLRALEAYHYWCSSAVTKVAKSNAAVKRIGDVLYSIKYEYRCNKHQSSKTTIMLGELAPTRDSAFMEKMGELVRLANEFPPPPAVSNWRHKSIVTCNGLPLFYDMYKKEIYFDYTNPNTDPPSHQQRYTNGFFPFLKAIKNEDGLIDIYMGNTRVTWKSVATKDFYTAIPELSDNIYRLEEYSLSPWGDCVIAALSGDSNEFIYFKADNKKLYTVTYDDKGRAHKSYTTDSDTVLRVLQTDDDNSAFFLNKKGHKVFVTGLSMPTFMAEELADPSRVKTEPTDAAPTAEEERLRRDIQSLLQTPNRPIRDDVSACLSPLAERTDTPTVPDKWEDISETVCWLEKSSGTGPEASPIFRNTGQGYKHNHLFRLSGGKRRYQTTHSNKNDKYLHESQDPNDNGLYLLSTDGKVMADLTGMYVTRAIFTLPDITWKEAR
ncbi:hypothetical protein J8273_7602 [Carpediemonas membranifera]|uniref:Uncharacterized protein n=1 Tax=Carpediemonas membranifera TaxID=201153 RepID=A0A8J6AQP3_9EUKA|nr:hypothetical protein J8273_7602 [Carpediemonas membranifera]|eukprot:KAG9391318.1 hypothetical protein J8273_7602 [Carpediemonas membranifera]